MTFKEFSLAIKEDARLTELLDRYDGNDSLTDEELQEMVDRSAAICGDEDDDDVLDFYGDYFDPADESPVDLYGSWWE